MLPDPPETRWNLPADPDTAVPFDGTPADPTPPVKETVTIHSVVAGTAVQMDPKHPLKIGPDYYPAGAIRRTMRV